MKGSAFYESGLRFSCKRCSSCCRFDSGFVFLSKKDLNKMALALNMNENSFLKTYCRWVTDWKGDEVLSLREKSNKDCVLWDSGCTVYETRPLQCITFPFWESIVSSADNWDIAATGCPGINNGDLHSQKAIEDGIKLRLSEPIINKPEVEL